MQRFFWFKTIIQKAYLETQYGPITLKESSDISNGLCIASDDKSAAAIIFLSRPIFKRRWISVYLAWKEKRTYHTL